MAVVLCALIAPGVARAHYLLDEANALHPDFGEELAGRLRELESRAGIPVGVILLRPGSDSSLPAMREAFDRLREGQSPDPREALVVILERRVVGLNLGGALRGKMHSGGLLEQLRRTESETVEVAVLRALATLVGKVAAGDPLASELSDESVRTMQERRRLAERAAFGKRAATWSVVGLILLVVAGGAWRLARRSGRRAS